MEADYFEFGDLPPIVIFELFPDGVEPYGGQTPVESFAFNEQFDFLAIDPMQGGPLASDDGMLIAA